MTEMLGMTTRGGTVAKRDDYAATGSTPLSIDDVFFLARAEAIRRDTITATTRDRHPLDWATVGIGLVCVLGGAIGMAVVMVQEVDNYAAEDWSAAVGVIPYLLLFLVGFVSIGLNRLHAETRDDMTVGPVNALRKLRKADQTRLDRLSSQHPVLGQLVPRQWWPASGDEPVKGDDAAFIKETLHAIQDDLPSASLAAEHVVELLNQAATSGTEDADTDAIERLRARYNSDDPDPDIASLIHRAEHQEEEQANQRIELRAQADAFSDVLRRERDALEAARLRAQLPEGDSDHG